MKSYRYINTGAVVTLLDLLDSADVDDAQDVAVFDEAGDFVCRCDGSWTAPYRPDGQVPADRRARARDKIGGTDMARTRIAQPADIATAVRMYYEKIVLTNSDIKALFGTDSSTRVQRLKEAAKQQMAAKGVMPFDAHTVYTEDAYAAWGLSITDLERRLDKLNRLREKLGDAPADQPPERIASPEPSDAALQPAS